VVRDLSLGGAFIETAALLDSGTAVRLFLAVPGRPGDEQPLEGWIVRVVRRRVRPGAGPLVGPPADAAPVARKDRYAGAPALRLGEMKAGQIRTVRLRLRAFDDPSRRRTDFFLDVGITCDLPGKLYYQPSQGVNMA